MRLTHRRSASLATFELALRHRFSGQAETGRPCGGSNWSDFGLHCRATPIHNHHVERGWELIALKVACDDYGGNSSCWVAWSADVIAKRHDAPIGTNPAHDERGPHVTLDTILAKQHNLLETFHH